MKNAPKHPGLTVRGFQIFENFIPRTEQESLVHELRSIAQRAPFRRPETRWGKQMSVQMTSAGKFGWISDRRGYRYEPVQPDGKSWPKIPQQILDLWHYITRLDREPDCCMVNFYTEGARMGLHQDRDEADFVWPVLSISMGDDGLFRIGNTTKGGSTESLWLKSGDIVLMGGEARLTYHGVDKIRPGSSTLLPDGGRINVTLRVVE